LAASELMYGRIAYGGCGTFLLYSLFQLSIYVSDLWS